jgi:hypothetical protein
MLDAIVYSLLMIAENTRIYLYYFDVMFNRTNGGVVESGCS